MLMMDGETWKGDQTFDIPECLVSSCEVLPFVNNLNFERNTDKLFFFFSLSCAVKQQKVMNMKQRTKHSSLQRNGEPKHVAASNTLVRCNYCHFERLKRTHITGSII